MSRLSKAAQDEILAIAERQGYVTPEDVLIAARPVKSALHSHIEWDSSKAAQAYQLAQCHELIQRVRYVLVRDDSPPLSVRALISVEDEGRHTFRTVQVVSQNPQLQNQVMARMKLDLEQLVAKYNTYKEFWPLLRSVLRRRARRSA